MLLFPSGAYSQSVTLGESAILPQADSGNGNLLVAQSATLSQTATIQSLSFYVTTAAGNLRLGIYDATGPGGGPGQKRAETAEITTAIGWNTASVITPVSLSAGTYWLAYLPSDNGLAFVKTQDSTSSGKYYTFTYGTMPAIFSTTPNSTASHWSFYATLSTVPDTVPPIISGVSASSITQNSATISWTTDENADTQVEYGLTTSYGNQTTLNTSMVTSHTQPISGLNVSTLYHYRVKSKDPSNNLTTSGDFTFTTTAPDTQAPTAPTNLSATAISSSQINLSWTASTDNIGVTGYRVERCQGSSCTNFAQVGMPSTTIFNDAGLTANTTYRYQVRATDAAGNPSSYSSIVSATTQSAPPPGSSALAQLAASMTPGTWTKLSTTNIVPAFVGTPAGCATNTTMPYSDALVWDSTSRQAFFLGGDHCGVSISGQSKFSSYSDATNTWQVRSDPSFFPMGHSYDHTAVDVGRGYIYFRPRDANVVHRYNINTNAWNTLPTPPSGNTCCDALSFSPELDGLVWVGHFYNQVLLFKESTQQWSTLGAVSGGSTWQMAEYNPVHKVLIFKIENQLYRLLSTGQIVSLGALPVSIYDGSGYNGVVTVDPVSGDYIFVTPTNHTFYKYNVLTNTSQLLASQPPVNLTNKFLLGTPVSNYGIILFVWCDAGTCGTLVYKHSSSTPPPSDTTPPSTPTNLSAIAVSSSQINLSWTASTDNVGVTSYRVERCQGSSCTTFAQVATPTGTTYNDTGLTANTIYRYQVRATDVVGNLSGYSNIVSVTTQTTPSFDFSLSNSGNSSVTQGQLTSNTISASLVSGTAQSVSFTISSLPSGVTSSFSPTGCTPTCSTTLTLVTIASTPIGTYTITVTSTSGSLIRTTSFTLTVISSTPSDFATRCAQSGVVKCVGFDSISEITGNWGINPQGVIPNPGVPAIDSLFKASGSGALKFAIAPGQTGGSAGSFFANFSNNLSTQFGANSEFYIQWRMRIDNNFYSATQGNAGMKHAIIGTGSRPGTPASSCTDLEIVTQNNSKRGFPQMYHSCAGDPINYAPIFEDMYGAYDFKLQNARSSPYCLYSQGQTTPNTFFPPTGNCFGYFTNEWMTFQVHVKLGPRQQIGSWWYFTNSTVELWLAREGQPAELVISAPGRNLEATEPLDQYGQIWLLPYSGGEIYPNGGTLWYDELIISQNKIADPSISTTPPPTPLLGDLNLDRTVNNFDWNIMAGVWFTNDPTADLNKDTIVNTADYYYIYANWGKSI